jgi:hypothetical protein
MPINRTASREAICLIPTLMKCGLDLGEVSIHVSPLSFFSTPVLIIDRKLETTREHYISAQGLVPIELFQCLSTEVSNCTEIVR